MPTVTVIHALKIPAREVDAGFEGFPLAARAAAELGVPSGEPFSFRILRRSLDARRGAPLLLYLLALEVDAETASPLRRCTGF